MAITYEFLTAELRQQALVERQKHVENEHFQAKLEVQILRERKQAGEQGLQPQIDEWDARIVGLEALHARLVARRAAAA